MKSIRARAPAAISERVRRTMQANVGRETSPEKALRSALHAAGLRFRKDYAPAPNYPCKADVVFADQRGCIFVDGCFYHGCPEHFKVPDSNADWWREKIADNQARDRRQTEWLEQQDWTVLRVWEHEIENDIMAIVEHVSMLVRGQD